MKEKDINTWTPDCLGASPRDMLQMSLALSKDKAIHMFFEGDEVFVALRPSYYQELLELANIKEITV